MTEGQTKTVEKQKVTEKPQKGYTEKLPFRRSNQRTVDHANNGGYLSILTFKPFFNLYHV